MRGSCVRVCGARSKVFVVNSGGGARCRFCVEVGGGDVVGDGACGFGGGVVGAVRIARNLAKTETENSAEPLQKLTKKRF